MKEKETPEPEFTIEDAMAQDYHELGRSHIDHHEPAIHPDIRKACWRSLLISVCCLLITAGAMYYFNFAGT